MISPSSRKFTSGRQGTSCSEEGGIVISSSSFKEQEDKRRKQKKMAARKRGNFCFFNISIPHFFCWILIMKKMLRIMRKKVIFLNNYIIYNRIDERQYIARKLQNILNRITETTLP